MIFMLITNLILHLMRMMETGKKGGLTIHATIQEPLTEIVEVGYQEQDILDTAKLEIFVM